MKQLYIAIICILLSSSLAAQEESIYKHYQFNPFLVNPAYAGFQDYHNIFLNYNAQWSTFPGNPKMVTAAYNGPVNERIGVGASFLSDRVASYNRTKGELAYTFKFILEEYKISLGLSTAYEQIRLDGEALLGPHIDASDPYIAEAIGGIQSFDAGIGAHAESDKIKAGIALPNLFRARLDENASAPGAEKTAFGESFLAYFGYNLPMEGYNFSLEPMVMLRQAKDGPLLVDLNLLSNFYEDQLVGGLTFTAGGGGKLAVLLGYKLENFGLYYSYTTAFSQLQQYSNGGHEISVGFNFSKREQEIEEIGGF